MAAKLGPTAGSGTVTERDTLSRDLSAKGAMFQPGVSNAILGLHQLENSNRGNNDDLQLASDGQGVPAGTASKADDGSERRPSHRNAAHQVSKSGSLDHLIAPPDDIQ